MLAEVEFFCARIGLLRLSEAERAGQGRHPGAHGTKQTFKFVTAQKKHVGQRHGQIGAELAREPWSEVRSKGAFEIRVSNVDLTST